MTRPIVLDRRDVLRLGGIAAITAAVGGTLAACSTAGGSPNQLQYMFWGSTGEQKAVTAMLQAYGKASKGASVRPLYTPGDDYDTKLTALIASNRTPDIAYLNTPMAYRIAQQGKLVNIAKYFDKYPQLKDRLPETFYWWDEEHTLGTQGANEAMLLWYDRKAFQDAGVDTPPADAASAWNWDQFIENATRLTVDQSGKRPDQAGFDPKRIKRFGTLAPSWAGAWYGLLLSTGVDFLDESGMKTQINSGPAITMFQNLVDMMYQHRVAPTPSQLGNNAPGTSVQLSSGRVAMAIDGQWSLLDISQTKTDYGIGVLPSYGTPMTATMGGPSGIFTATKHLDEALELYSFQSDPSKSSLFSSGLWMPLERKYYTDSAEIAKWTDNPAHPKEYKTAVIDYTLNHGKAYFYQKTKNIDAVDKLLTPAFERMTTGKGKPADVLNELAGKLNAGVLQGAFPTPKLT